ncbi:hypothetical protein ACGFYT_27265 [Streptomyces sp. NPDC048208]|uniref:hypothetical protein n=1 Tax=Streptomyces sp. NPDC048208 TaxID=3365515 RepID=UPI00371BE330
MNLPSTGATHVGLLPAGQGQPYAAYEIRSLVTDAERAEAEALIIDRLDWLARRYRTRPDAAEMIPPLFREAALPTGLFDDGVLICCLLVDRDPDVRCWGTASCGPGLLLRHVYSLPGRASAGAVRMLTLWSSDVAARMGWPWVRAEALLAAGADTPAELIAHLSRYAANLGWTSLGTGRAVSGERVVRLHLRAELHENLSAVVRSTIHIPDGFERSAP